MSRNYELMRKAGDAIHSHREADPYIHSLPLDVPVAEMATGGEQSGNPDASILDFVQAVFRRRRWMYFWTATMLAAAGLVCLLMTPQYKAEAKLEILKQNTSGLSLNTGSATDASSDPLDFNMTQQTQIAVLKSDVLALRVMQELKLAGASHFNPSGAATAEPAQLSEIAPDKKVARALKTFKSNLKVSAVSGTRLIKVSYLHPDPKMAARIVNQLMADLIEYNFQVRYNATIKATDWLQRELVDLKSQLEKSQQRAAQLQKESGIFGQDEKNNIVLTRLDQLNNQVTSAEADRVIKENVYRLSRSGNPELVAGMLGSQSERSMPESANPAALLNTLRQQEASLSAEYADASAKYGPAYPRLIQIKEKLNSVRSSISAELGKVAAQAKNEYELAASREAAARKAFAGQKTVAAQMNDKATDFLIAKHEAESSRVLYEHLLEKLKEAGVLAGLHSSSLHVLDSAEVPTSPARPNVPLYLGFGGIGGVFLGLVSVFIVEAMDRTVRDVTEIEITTRVPVLGIIPDAGAKRQTGFKLLPKMGLREDPQEVGQDGLLRSLGDPAVIEAFRAVRTALLLSRLHESSRVLLVTSAMPQEGKSFASLNLAAALTYSGARVLLVDADLQRGSLSRAFNQGTGTGLSDIIRDPPEFVPDQLPDRLEPSTAYRTIEQVPKLTFMPAGDCPRDASELLGSRRMSTIIESWRNQFDYVLIDTSPALVVTDAVVLSRKVDAVIVVVRFAVTSQPCIQRTIRLLRDVQAPRLGMLLNAMERHFPESYGYYGLYGTQGAGVSTGRAPLQRGR